MHIRIFFFIFISVPFLSINEFWGGFIFLLLNFCFVLLPFLAICFKKGKCMKYTDRWLITKGYSDYDLSYALVSDALGVNRVLQTQVTIRAEVKVSTGVLRYWFIFGSSLLGVATNKVLIHKEIGTEKPF